MFYFILFVVIAAFLLLSSLILFVTGRIFQLKTLTYSRSMLIVAIEIVAAAICKGIALLGVSFVLTQMVEIVIGYFIFLFFFKKWHQIS